MLNFDNETQVITMIAKDTGDFVFKLDNYILDDGDVLFFTVNDDIEKAGTPLIQKRIDSFKDGAALIHLSALETNLPVGKYYYDIEVNTADGRVDTVVGPAKFKIKGGVKY